MLLRPPIINIWEETYLIPTFLFSLIPSSTTYLIPNVLLSIQDQVWFAASPSMHLGPRTFLARTFLELEHDSAGTFWAGTNNWSTLLVSSRLVWSLMLVSSVLLEKYHEHIGLEALRARSSSLLLVSDSMIMISSNLDKKMELELTNVQLE